MIFHENRLPADDSHEISYLIFLKIRKDVSKFVVCCSRDWCFYPCCFILRVYEPEFYRLMQTNEGHTDAVRNVIHIKERSQVRFMVFILKYKL